MEWLGSLQMCPLGLLLIASSKQGMRLLQVLQQIRIIVFGSRQDLRARTHVTFY